MSKTLEKLGQQLRPMRYSDSELSLIKNTFSDQVDLLISIRKFLLQGEMEVSELDYLKSYTNKSEVLTILRKSVLAPLNKGAPPFQTVDLFSHMDLQPVPLEHAYFVILGKAVANRYLIQRFNELEGVENKDTVIKFDDLINVADKTHEDVYVEFIARNFLLSHIDSQLFGSLMIIAGTKDETVEQQKKRLSQDSNK